MIKKGDDWKVYSIQRVSDESTNEDGRIVAEAPGVGEQLKMVSSSMQVFRQSLTELSMERFHTHVSELWRTNSSLEEFENSFAPAIRNPEVAAQIADLEGLVPLITKKELTEEGALTVEGYFQSKPRLITFKHDYIRDGLDWKLIGFEFSGELVGETSSEPELISKR